MGDRSDYFRRYRDANRDRLNAYRRDYNRKNKLKISRRLATYYNEKAEELEKIEVEKSENNFDCGNEP